MGCIPFAFPSWEKLKKKKNFDWSKMANNSKRYSTVWNHFEIKDRENHLAECNYCLNTFSFKSTVNNLRKHLYSKHGYLKEADKDEEGTDCEEQGDEIEESKKIWEFFEPKDETTDIATCNLCSLDIKYGADKDELWVHLRDCHEEKIDGEEMENDEEYLEDDKSDLQGTQSKAWRYFKILDPILKSASCRLCDTVLSYRSSVSNLVKHAIRKHKINKGDCGDEDQLQRRNRSLVWLYFKSVDPIAKTAQCTLCSKMLSHVTTTSNLKKHLLRKHPTVKIPKRGADGTKRILLSAGGELYEVQPKKENDDDQNDPIEMDTVYLDDISELEPSETKRGTRTQSMLFHASDSSSDEEITLERRFVKKKSDSIDNFGRYIASLLRQLPKEISNQLQSDFVKQIMNTQLALETKAMDGNQTSAYSITIRAEEKLVEGSQ